MATKKTWHEKLADSHDLPKVNPIPPRMQKRHGEGTIAIPAPMEVDRIMRAIPSQKLATIADIAAVIAREHGATIGCTITTGIFAWIAANAAQEDEAAGKKNITPYWRTLKADGELNAKYPGGIDGLMGRLEAEGHVVVKRGARYFVKDYEKRLAKL